ncbi:B- and T-lymphocyte attenuator isoform X3 [Mastomys coucha]|uniref:B- and T-lymphocyte attenuator isoform X3 n=1 Tax=Mastomys coucha TaxID=35658 RepID=UPI0012617F70|nr:B- and T-lymphocyte attenuator isoform X3 [Mastomys coucha]
MKTLPAMLGTPRLFREFFILHLGLWSILCKEPTKRIDEDCQVQVKIKRNSEFSAWTGELFKIECPVTYCVHRPNVTWCKHNGTICVPLELGPQLHTSWQENQPVPVFILHFEPIHLSDDGLYSCSTNLNSEVINSHAVTIHVTERTQNYSEYQLIRKEKKPSDLEGRETNLVDIPVSSRTNSQTLPSETGIYDNDPWSSLQEESESTISLQLERNKQGIVYASLNHCAIGRNARQASNMQEEYTEYASICVRSSACH